MSTKQLQADPGCDSDGIPEAGAGDKKAVKWNDEEDWLEILEALDIEEDNQVARTVEKILSAVQVYKESVRTLEVAHGAWTTLEAETDGSSTQLTGNRHLIEAVDLTRYTDVQVSLDSLLASSISPSFQSVWDYSFWVRKKLVSYMGMGTVKISNTFPELKSSPYPAPDHYPYSFPSTVFAIEQTQEGERKLRADLLSNQLSHLTKDHSALDSALYPSRLDEIAQIHAAVSRKLETLSVKCQNIQSGAESGERGTAGDIIEVNTMALDLVPDHCDLLNTWRQHIHGAAVRLGDSQVRRVVCEEKAENELLASAANIKAGKVDLDEAARDSNADAEITDEWSAYESGRNPMGRALQGGGFGGDF